MSVGGVSFGVSLPSENTFYCPLIASDGGSVIDHAEMKSLIDLEDLVIPPAPLFEGSEASTRQLFDALETTATTCCVRNREFESILVVANEVGRDGS